MSIQKKTYDIVYYDENGDKEVIYSCSTFEEATAVYFQWTEGDIDGKKNMSYDIEENYIV